MQKLILLTAILFRLVFSQLIQIGNTKAEILIQLELSQIRSGRSYSKDCDDLGSATQMYEDENDQNWYHCGLNERQVSPSYNKMLYYVNNAIQSYVNCDEVFQKAYKNMTEILISSYINISNNKLYREIYEQGNTCIQNANNNFFMGSQDKDINSDHKKIMEEVKTNKRIFYTRKIYYTMNQFKNLTQMYMISDFLKNLPSTELSQIKDLLTLNSTQFSQIAQLKKEIETAKGNMKTDEKYISSTIMLLNGKINATQFQYDIASSKYTRNISNYNFEDCGMRIERITRQASELCNQTLANTELKHKEDLAKAEHKYKEELEKVEMKHTEDLVKVEHKYQEELAKAEMKHKEDLIKAEHKHKEDSEQQKQKEEEEERRAKCNSTELEMLKKNNIDLFNNLYFVNFNSSKEDWQQKVYHVLNQTQQKLLQNLFIDLKETRQMISDRYKNLINWANEIYQFRTYQIISNQSSQKYIFNILDQYQQNITELQSLSQNSLQKEQAVLNFINDNDIQAISNEERRFDENSFEQYVYSSQYFSGNGDVTNFQYNIKNMKRAFEEYLLLPTDIQERVLNIDKELFKIKNIDNSTELRNMNYWCNCMDYTITEDLIQRCQDYVTIFIEYVKESLTNIEKYKTLFYELRNLLPNKIQEMKMNEYQFNETKKHLFGLKSMDEIFDERIVLSKDQLSQISKRILQSDLIQKQYLMIKVNQQFRSHYHNCDEFILSQYINNNCTFYQFMNNLSNEFKNYQNIQQIDDKSFNQLFKSILVSQDELDLAFSDIRNYQKSQQRNLFTDDLIQCNINIDKKGLIGMNEQITNITISLKSMEQAQYQIKQTSINGLTLKEGAQLFKKDLMSDSLSVNEQQHYLHYRLLNKTEELINMEEMLDEKIQLIKNQKLQCIGKMLADNQFKRISKQTYNLQQEMTFQFNKYFETFKEWALKLTNITNKTSCCDLFPYQKASQLLMKKSEQIQEWIRLQSNLSMSMSLQNFKNNMEQYRLMMDFTSLNDQNWNILFSAQKKHLVESLQRVSLDIIQIINKQNEQIVKQYEFSRSVLNYIGDCKNYNTSQLFDVVDSYQNKFNAFVIWIKEEIQKHRQQDKSDAIKILINDKHRKNSEISVQKIVNNVSALNFNKNYFIKSIFWSLNSQKNIQFIVNKIEKQKSYFDTFFFEYSHIEAFGDYNYQIYQYMAEFDNEINDVKKFKNVTGVFEKIGKYLIAMEETIKNIKDSNQKNFTSKEEIIHQITAQNLKDNKSLYFDNEKRLNYKKELKMEKLNLVSEDQQFICINEQFGEILIRLEEYSQYFNSDKSQLILIKSMIEYISISSSCEYVWNGIMNTNFKIMQSNSISEYSLNVNKYMTCIDDLILQYGILNNRFFESVIRPVFIGCLENQIQDLEDFEDKEINDAY